MWRRDSCWKDRDQHEERDIGRQPHNPWQYDGNEIGMSGHTAALVTTVIARMARRQVAEHSRAGVDTEISTEFPQRWLRQQPCAQAALSSPCAMLLGASQQGNAIFCAMATPCFIAMGQREKEHGACNEPQPKRAALSVTTAQHLLHRHHFPSSLFTSLSDSSVFCLLDFMSCSVALEVMPHSATSRATGDDTSTIMSWNWGV